MNWLLIILAHLIRTCKLAILMQNWYTSNQNWYIDAQYTKHLEKLKYSASWVANNTHHQKLVRCKWLGKSRYMHFKNELSGMNYTSLAIHKCT
jgi:hypothetical protein